MKKVQTTSNKIETKKYKALFTGAQFNHADLKTLKNHGISIVESSPTLNEEELIKQLQGKDIYIIGGIDKATKKVLEQTNLKLIIFYGTGYEDYIDVKKAKQLGIHIANTPKANAYTVAEHTVALILDGVKEISKLNNQVKSGQWEVRTAWDLNGKTLGIIGMGAIGTHVAQIMKNGFNMNILYFNRSVNQLAKANLNAKKVSLNKLLMTSDVISLHIPLTSFNRNLIDTSQFDLIQDHAIIVNTSRAEIISKNALKKALDKGRLKAISFDGYYNEPINNLNDPILANKNFTITPHTAYSSIDAKKNMNKMVIDNIKKWITSGIPKFAI